MTENAKIDASIILPELMPANIFSGPCFGDMTPSESSQAVDQTDVPNLSIFPDEVLIESTPNDVDVINTVGSCYSPLESSMYVQKSDTLQASVRSNDPTPNAYASDGEKTVQMSISVPLINDTAVLDSQLSIPSTNNLRPSSFHPDAQSITETPAALTDLSPAIFDAELRSPKPSASVPLSDTSATIKDSALDPAVISNVDSNALSVTVPQDSLLPTTMRYDSDASTCIDETSVISEAAAFSSSLPASPTHVEDTASCGDRALVSSFLLDDSHDIGFDAKLDGLPSSSPPSSSPPLFSSPPALPSSQTTAPGDDHLVSCDSVQSFLNGNPQSHDQSEKINDTDMDQFDASVYKEDVDYSLNKIDKPEERPTEPVSTSYTKLAEEGLCEHNPPLLLSPLPSHPSNLPTNEVESGKRKRDLGEDEMLSMRRMKIGKGAGDAPEQEVSRAQTPANSTPTRSTVASHKAQHDKLTAPFRSPLMKKVHFGISAVGLEEETKLESRKEMNPAEPSKSATHVEGANSNIFPLQTKKRNHTQRAASQFKSPLSTTASSNLISSVRLTPTIQAMERKLQILRRAVKVKKENEAEILEDLANKWTEAGREVAWEVWNLAKENDAGTATSWGSNKRNFQDSWGWDEGADAKRHKLDNGKSWGWDMGNNEHTIEDKQTNEDDGDCEEATEDTMGTMLRQLGIFPESLGWCEIEGSFVDS